MKQPGKLVVLTGASGSGKTTILVRRALRCELRRLRRRGPLPYAAAIAMGGVFAIVTS